MINGVPKIFLAANSADGFINNFKSFTENKQGWYTYIIKGGPGTGKSSFMKRVAQTAAEKGENVIISPCSSDPDSLDAVMIEGKKIMILDGTAPHTVDPTFPGISDEIINFGEFWEREILVKEKENIINASNSNKLFHKRAALCIKAAGRVKRDNMKIALLATDIEATVNYAEKQANKYLTSSCGNKQETVCYLNGITPKGEVCFSGTIDSLVENKVVINDELLTVSNIFLSIVRDIALSKGYSIITVKNNVLPNEKIDHIIIKEANVAFCTETKNMPIESNNRHIRAERFMDEAQLSKYAKRIKFNKRLEKEFTKQAIESLKQAKLSHDELEKYYIKAMDFDKANEFLNRFLEEIF